MHKYRYLRMWSVSGSLESAQLQTFTASRNIFSRYNFVCLVLMSENSTMSGGKKVVVQYFVFVFFPSVFFYFFDCTFVACTIQTHSVIRIIAQRALCIARHILRIIKYLYEKVFRIICQHIVCLSTTLPFRCHHW